MNRSALTAVLLACFMAAPFLAFAEDGKKDHGAMRKHCAEMMKDKEMMSMMMDCIASDDGMRMDMMDKMNGKVKGDKKKMKALCRVFMKGDGMRDMVEGECKMGMDPQKASGMKCEGMMGDMNGKKGSPAKKGKKTAGADEHEGHH